MRCSGKSGSRAATRAGFRGAWRILSGKRGSLRAADGQSSSATWRGCSCAWPLPVSSPKPGDGPSNSEPPADGTGPTCPKHRSTARSKTGWPAPAGRPRPTTAGRTICGHRDQSNRRGPTSRIAIAAIRATSSPRRCSRHPYRAGATSPAPAFRLTRLSRLGGIRRPPGSAGPAPSGTAGAITHLLPCGILGR